MSEEQAENVLAEAAKLANKTSKIVVIDDDTSFLEEMRGHLENNGYSVSTFETAQHAFRFMKSQPWSWIPKLVITDVVMDGIGGYQVVRRVEELYPGRKIPTVVVSKLTSMDYSYEAEAAGAAAFLTKPISEEKILLAMEHIKRNNERNFISDYELSTVKKDSTDQSSSY